MKPGSTVETAAPRGIGAHPGGATREPFVGIRGSIEEEGAAGSVMRDNAGMGMTAGSTCAYS